MSAIASDPILQSEVVVVEIDYSHTPEEIVAEKYKGVDLHFLHDASDIHFLRGVQPPHKGMRKVGLCHFSILTRQGWDHVQDLVRSYDSVNPWAPADAWELLAYSTAKPDEQLRFDIFALGTKATSAPNPNGVVPYLTHVEMHQGRSIERLVGGYEYGDRLFRPTRWLASRPAQ